MTIQVKLLICHYFIYNREKQINILQAYNNNNTKCVRYSRKWE